MPRIITALFTLVLALGTLWSCASLNDAWMGTFGISKDGKVDAEIDVAGKHGDFNRNTGLNLTTGDNSTAALILVVILGVSMFFIYPIQRKLRLRNEEKVIQRHLNSKEDSNARQ